MRVVDYYKWNRAKRQFAYICVSVSVFLGLSVETLGNLVIGAIGAFVGIFGVSLLYSLRDD